MTWADSLAPLRQPNFRFYVIARFINLLGSTMGSVALTFAVLEITGSANALGQVLAAHSIPMLLFLLVGGVIADRFGRTQVIQVSNVVAGLSNLGIAALVISGTAELWHLIVLTAINGVAAAISFPALTSVLPQLVDPDDLQPANALVSMLRSSLTIAGPALGGVLVATAGGGWAIGIDGLAYLISAAVLTRVHLPAPVRASAASALSDLREGWHYVRSTTWLWSTIVIFCAICALLHGGFLTLGPIVATSTAIKETGWGLILSAEAVGLLITGVVMLRVRLERPLLWGLIGTAFYGLPMIALGLKPDLAVVMLAALIAGAGVEIFGLGWNLAMQEHVPPAMLSRAMSYDALGSFAAIPLGQLAAGPIAAAIGTSQTLTIAGVGVAVLALVPLCLKEVRTLPRTTSAPASTPR